MRDRVGADVAGDAVADAVRRLEHGARRRAGGRGRRRRSAARGAVVLDLDDELRRVAVAAEQVELRRPRLGRAEQRPVERDRGPRRARIGGDRRRRRGRPRERGQRPAVERSSATVTPSLTDQTSSPPRTTAGPARKRKPRSSSQSCTTGPKVSDASVGRERGGRAARPRPRASAPHAPGSPARCASVGRKRIGTGSGSLRSHGSQPSGDAA